VIRAFVVDREALSVERLSIMLAKLGDVIVVGTAASASRAAKDVALCKPHVLFVEAEQRGDVPALVREMHESGTEAPCFVLVSTTSEMAIGGFDAGAVDYLVKPFPQERLAETLRRVRKAPKSGLSSRRGSAANASSKKLKPGLY
jgi:DNA-binding LytR/AlgR family response regulator